MGTRLVTYNLEDVKKVLCLLCSKPIGDKPFVEVTTLARFGQLLFEHKKC